MLRRWRASLLAAGLGGAVYGFSPALLAAGIGHFHLQFAVLPPLIIDALLGILTGRGRTLLAGLSLGLLIAAQLFTGEELLADTAVAAGVMVVVLILGHPRATLAAVRTRAWAILGGLGAAIAVVVLTCGYALWVQFRGPLASHGSPWLVSEFHNYPYAFVTPSGALLFHTSASAAAAGRLSRAAARVPGLPGLAAADRAGRGRGLLRPGSAGPAGRGDVRAARTVLPGRGQRDGRRMALPGRLPPVALAAAPPATGRSAPRPARPSSRTGRRGPCSPSPWTGPSGWGCGSGGPG